MPRHITENDMPNFAALITAIGYIDGAKGTANAAAGATVTRTGTGTYSITFGKPKLDANYIVICTVAEANATRDDINITVDNQTLTGFRITIHEGDNGTAADVQRDRDFYFVVYEIN